MKTCATLLRLQRESAAAASQPPRTETSRSERAQGAGGVAARFARGANRADPPSGNPSVQNFWRLGARAAGLVIGDVRVRPLPISYENTSQIALEPLATLARSTANHAANAPHITAETLPALILLVHTLGLGLQAVERDAIKAASYADLRPTLPKSVLKALCLSALRAVAPFVESDALTRCGTNDLARLGAAVALDSHGASSRDCLEKVVHALSLRPALYVTANNFPALLSAATHCAHPDRNEVLQKLADALVRSGPDGLPVSRELTLADICACLTALHAEVFNTPAAVAILDILSFVTSTCDPLLLTATDAARLVSSAAKTYGERARALSDQAKTVAALSPQDALRLAYHNEILSYIAMYCAAHADFEATFTLEQAENVIEGLRGAGMRDQYLYVPISNAVGAAVDTAQHIAHVRDRLSERRALMMLRSRPLSWAMARHVANATPPNLSRPAIAHITNTVLFYAQQVQTCEDAAKNFPTAARSLIRTIYRQGSGRR